jgi:3-dehydroquinate dehydratase-2
MQEIYAATPAECSDFIVAESTMVPRQTLRNRAWTVTILILQGPHATGGFRGADVSTSLQATAQAAGRSLSVCTCSELRELVAHVRAASGQDTEFMLLDPGDLTEDARAHPEEGLEDALSQLVSPYVEVHDDSGATLESIDGSRRSGPLATIVIHGDLAASYRIAMGIALRRLAA